MKKESVEEVKLTLTAIYQDGFTIGDFLKEKYNSFSSRPKEEILTDPDLFSYSLFGDFWRLFKLISENIENPLIQPWIRVIIEQSCDLIWYSQQNEKKELATKYFLCILGLLGGKQGDLNYDSFLKLIITGKNKFEELKNKGYPIKEAHKLMHNLFPPISEDRLPEEIKKYFLTMNLNSIKKEQLDLFFRDMSLYHHPSIMINNLEREFENKSHIFRCFALISLCGLSLIRFSIDNLQYIPKDDSIEELNKKVNELIKKLYLIKNEN
jgi:hypothetical protein